MLQLENKAYNERESCFDQFSDLFKKFQSVSKSDMNGSKTADFWAELTRRGLDVSLVLTNLNNAHYDNLLFASRSTNTDHSIRRL